MKRSRVTASRLAASLLAASLLAAGLLAHAMAAGAAESATDTAAVEKQLDAARARLDAAARDVARLSRELHADDEVHHETIRIMHGGRGSILGINIGGEQALSEGVEVVGVSPGGPADRAGLRTGDVVLAVDNVVLRRSDGRPASRQLVEHLNGVAPGTTVKVGYRRGQSKHAVDIKTMAAEPAFAGVLRGAGMLQLPDGLELPHFEQFIGHGGALRGLELVSVTPGLGQYFGTDKGLLVVRAPADQRLALMEGDVLQSIAGRTPDSPGHALRILRSYEGGEKLALQVLRMRKPMQLELTMPAAEPGMQRHMLMTPPRPPVPPAPPAPRASGKDTA